MSAMSTETVNEPEVSVDKAARRALVDGNATVADLRAAAAMARLSYPHRPAGQETTVAAHLAAACKTRTWLRHGSPLKDVVAMCVVTPDGHAATIERDERLGTVRRELLAALDAGAVITHVVLDLVRPARQLVSMAASFKDRVAAARAAESVIAQARPTAVDIVDETAMTVVAGFGGIDIYTAGATVFVQLSGDDRVALLRDMALVEDLCFEAGATAIRECEQDIGIAEAMETLVVSCKPVLASLGYEPVYDSVVSISELAGFIGSLTGIEEACRTRLSVVFDAATGTVGCWLPPRSHAALLPALRYAIDQLGAAARSASQVA